MVGCPASTPSTLKAINEGHSSDSLALQVMNTNGYSSGLKDVEVNLQRDNGPSGLAQTLDAVLLRVHLLRRAVHVILTVVLGVAEGIR